MSHLKLLLLCALTRALLAAPGDACLNRNLTGVKALDQLAGQHLLACGFHWPPSLVHTQTADGGVEWSGFDVDLLNYVAARLRFNYTIVAKEKMANELWDDALTRVVDECDVVLTVYLAGTLPRLRAQIDAIVMP